MAFQFSEELVPDGIAGPRTLKALSLIENGDCPSAIPGVTVEIVSKMFPSTPVRNIQVNLPFVLASLVASALADKPMVLMALATIRAETEGFVPISEGKSRYNTSPNGHPFDLYDNRKDLGNRGAPDGDRFKGRGFIQLTGRANYNQHGQAIGLGNGLIANPDQANDPTIAAHLLASFIKSKEVKIQRRLSWTRCIYQCLQYREQVDCMMGWMRILHRSAFPMATASSNAAGQPCAASAASCLPPDNRP